MALDYSRLVAPPRSSTRFVCVRIAQSIRSLATRVPAMRSRNLIAYLVARFCAGTATTLLRAGVLWHVFALSHSPFQLGLIGLVQFVPALGLMLLGGALADTHDRRRIMMASQWTWLAAAIVLCGAMRTGSMSLPLLYATVLVVAVGVSFDSPARVALLPTLVPRPVLPRAVTIASTNQAFAFATGPALAGMLIAAAGVTSVYVAYAVLVAGSLAAMAFLRPGRQEPSGRAPSLAAIREGLRFVRSRQVILGCMALDMLAVIFGGASALLPVYASDILHVGPRGYGLLSSAAELGAIATSLVLSFTPPIRRAGRALLVTVALFGVATIVFGLSRSFPLSIAAYVLVGVADQVSVVLRATAIQLSTPDALRGRVSALNLLFIGASNQLGAAESGFVAALTSAPFAVVSGGVGCLLVVAVVAATMPQLRRYRIDRGAADVAA
jgi:MFS family permease